MAEQTPTPIPLLPLVDVNQTLLPPDPAEAVAALEQALSADDARERHTALRAVATNWPTFIESWAQLGESALGLGQEIEAYAFFRTGYHRGLDRLRGNGWRGAGQVPWAHGPNRGFLLALHGLMRTSAALGEENEVARCRQFLLDLDPSDPLDVRERH